MNPEIIKEVGAIIIEVAKNGGTDAVHIFAIIYGVDIIKLLVSWIFVLLIGKGIFEIFKLVVTRVKE